MEATTGKMLKPKQVAEILGCGYVHALELMGSEAMNSVDISTSPRKRMLRITPENLEKFIQNGGKVEN